ncbi:MAG: hypothetical protein ABF292_02850, partial [Desulfobacterales bacterium]
PSKSRPTFLKTDPVFNVRQLNCSAPSPAIRSPWRRAQYSTGYLLSNRSSSILPHGGLPSSQPRIIFAYTLIAESV